MSDAFETAKVGDEQSFDVPDVNRTHFVRYAGGGGDFNPIHHDRCRRVAHHA